MSKNPVIPYILIFSLGIGLIFFLSLYGLDQKKEIASQGEDANPAEEVVTTEFDPDVAIGKCIGCHGGELEGGMGGAAPALVGLGMSADEIVDVLKNGQGAMPAQVPNAIPAEHAEDLAEYLLTLQ
ncbi:c-type cytochrome [Sporosarcina sp. CAU 1771]